MEVLMGKHMKTCAVQIYQWYSMIVAGGFSSKPSLITGGSPCFMSSILGLSLSKAGMHDSGNSAPWQCLRTGHGHGCRWFPESNSHHSSDVAMRSVWFTQMQDEQIAAESLLPYQDGATVGPHFFLLKKTASVKNPCEVQVNATEIPTEKCREHGHVSKRVFFFWCITRPPSWAIDQGPPGLSKH